MYKTGREASDRLPLQDLSRSSEASLRVIADTAPVAQLRRARGLSVP